MRQKFSQLVVFYRLTTEKCELKYNTELLPMPLTSGADVSMPAIEPQ